MNKYTKEENEFLINNFFEYSLTELSELFLEKFDRKINHNSLGKHCNSIGLKKTAKITKHEFSNEQDEFIVKNNYLGNNKLLIAFNNEFGLKLTYHQIAGRKRKLNICKKIGFSNEEDLWLKENYGNYPMSKIHEMFCLKFRNVSSASLSNRTLFLGLREKIHHYTEEENEWLTKNIRLYTYPELTKKFNDTFQTAVTEISIRGQCLQYLNVKRGENSFSASTLPIGSEVEKNGIIYVKISEKPFDRKSRWKPQNRLVYEREHGEIPKGGSIIFLDGDKSNYDIDNLYCVNNSVRACLAREKWFSEDRELTTTAIKCAELMCKLKE